MQKETKTVELTLDSIIEETEKPIEAENLVASKKKFKNPSYVAFKEGTIFMPHLHPDNQCGVTPGQSDFQYRIEVSSTSLDANNFVMDNMKFNEIVDELFNKPKTGNYWEASCEQLVGLILKRVVNRAGVHVLQSKESKISVTVYSNPPYIGKTKNTELLTKGVTLEWYWGQNLPSNIAHATTKTIVKPKIKHGCGIY